MPVSDECRWNPAGSILPSSSFFFCGFVFAEIRSAASLEYVRFRYMAVAEITDLFRILFF